MNGALIGESKPSKIKFGIMCSGTSFAQWESVCIEKLLEISRVECSLLIIDQESLEQKSRFSKFKQFRNLKTILWHIYRIITHKQLKALRSVNLESKLNDVPLIYCKTIKKGKYYQHFLREDIQEIMNHQLDFILRFGFNLIRGEVLEVARYGVWSFHHDDEQKYRGTPPGFWEIFYGDPVTGSLLQRINDRLDGGVILRKGFFRTKSYSYGKNLNLILSESAHWPYQVCLDIKNGNTNYIDGSPSNTNAPIFRSPNNKQFLKYFCKLFWNILNKIIERIFIDYIFNIGIIEKPIHYFLENDEYPKPKWIPEGSPDTYVADPFLFQKKNEEFLHIIFEYYEHKKLKGNISTLRWDGSNSSNLCTALSLDYHLSYPFIFESKGLLYCIPESLETGSIQLFRFDDKNRWVKEHTLIDDFPGADASIVFYQDRWWMFVTHAKDGTEHKLYVWYAEDLKSVWKPHEQNPVKFDIQSSRSAGPPFIYRDNLFRPSQNCSTTYGGSLTINKVNLITPTEFSEECAKQILPQRDSLYPDGLHTLSSLNDVSVIDGKRKVFVPFVPILLKAKLQNTLKSIF